jgi:hypothetical protein
MKAALKAQRRPDAEIVAEIVAELKTGGDLNDPRLRAERPTTLAEFVPQKVQHSLDTIRLLKDFKRPANWPAAPSMADIRKAAKAFRKVKSLFINDDQMIPQKLEMSAAGQQEPPPRAKAMKFQCASEAFFLMEYFTTLRPTNYGSGPCCGIAMLIYEAVTGKYANNMKRSVTLVLKNRRHHRPMLEKRRNTYYNR